MNRRSFLTALLGTGIAALFGWKPEKLTPFWWEVEPAWSLISETHRHSEKWNIINDFSYFTIVDRVGMDSKHIENVSADTRYPAGRSGLVRYYRERGK